MAPNLQVCAGRRSGLLGGEVSPLGGRGGGSSSPTIPTPPRAAHNLEVAPHTRATHTSTQHNTMNKNGNTHTHTCAHTCTCTRTRTRTGALPFPLGWLLCTVDHIQFTKTRGFSTPAGSHRQQRRTSNRLGRSEQWRGRAGGLPKPPRDGHILPRSSLHCPRPGWTYPFSVASNRPTRLGAVSAVGSAWSSHPLTVTAGC